MATKLKTYLLTFEDRVEEVMGNDLNDACIRAGYSSSKIGALAKVPTRVINCDTPEVQEAVNTLLHGLWQESDCGDSPEEITAHHQQIVYAVSSLLGLYTPYAPPQLTFKW